MPIFQDIIQKGFVVITSTFKTYMPKIFRIRFGEMSEYITTHLHLIR